MPRDTWMSISNFIHFDQLCPIVSYAMGVPMLSWQAVTLLYILLRLYIYRTIMTYAKLREFRGPSWTGISNWPYSMAMLRGNCHEWYIEVNKKYVWIYINNKPSYKRSDWYYKAARIEYRRDNVFTPSALRKVDDTVRYSYTLSIGEGLISAA
ncbi:hypothetical protein N7467_010296 [Penicillium canescens]|nr:hypothetical protein N7467_010296 [Penicillium canescens]